MPDRLPQRHVTPKRTRTEYRENAADRGYDWRWQKARKEFLAANPVCVECMQPATVVDHIIPHRGDMEKFWDVDNWQPLCQRHHNLKTAKGE